MPLEIDPFSNVFDSQFKIFHNLMGRKVRQILLVSTPYDAWIMEEDCRLSERIINEYRGLNLSHPPIINWAPTAEEALAKLDEQSFDMVITMPRLADMDAMSLGCKVKEKAPDLPVIMLAHGNMMPDKLYKGQPTPEGIDLQFVWSGNTDILVALVKSAEDRMNVMADTSAAGIRVILLVEDSPVYLSSLLPILYRELVYQTQAVMEEGLNEEHRLLTMRARPKILIAETYEDAVALYKQFEPYVLGVISDVRYPRNGQIDAEAGVKFLKMVESEHFDIPLLMTSAEAPNREKARLIPAVFVDKNSPTLHAEVRSFFRDHLGFGHFVFRMPDGRIVGRAASMRELEILIRDVPTDAFLKHARNNDFSRWLFARTETVLAKKMRPLTENDFKNVNSLRAFLANAIHTRRRRRQKGIVANFDARDFDLETEFMKIGNGSLGGKARGLAFVSSLLRRHIQFHKKFDGIDLFVPQTLVITTDGFETFVEKNNLRGLAKIDLPDNHIAEAFLNGQFPQSITTCLRTYLTHIHYPLAIRSSSLLEDAQFRAYAGLYRTYMISNDHPDIEARLAHLIQAIKLVYASTYFQDPKSFSRRVGHRTEEEQMAVIIQQLVGEQYDCTFYPAISGVAQSHNYYPFGRMQPEEGIATIAMGMGKAVVEGEKTLRFSPRYPQLLPQRSSVDDILANSQRYFYSLRMDRACPPLGINESAYLEKHEVSDAIDEPPMQFLCSSFVPSENRIRDTARVPGGYPVLTFANILKYNQFPLANILVEALDMGSHGMGCAVEMEFSVDLHQQSGGNPQFAFLQLRPMTARAELMQVDISTDEIEKAFCYSASQALGNAVNTDLSDIVYVKPDAFDPAQTVAIAQEIGAINAHLESQQRKYLLIGPGRWGSSDRWLGIPVAWQDIAGVGAIVESSSDKLKAEPSQGSHFFHNITTLGINYITVRENGTDFIQWDWVQKLPTQTEKPFVRHVRLPAPMTLKVDGRQSRGVIFV